jgi:hypothetical protein
MKMPEAPYSVRYCAALAGEETHTIAESPIKPCAVEMATCVFGEEQKKKLETVQLSNNTVERRIRDLSADIEKNVASRLKCSFAFSLQVDKSTDVAGLAVSSACVCTLRIPEQKRGSFTL